MSRLLFLDVDGVLNTGGEGFLRTYFGPAPVMRPELVARLNTIVAATDCTIVWSTSWRVGDMALTKLCDSLIHAGATFKKPRYTTPDLARRVSEGTDSLLIAPSRGNEIKTWLQENTDVFAHESEMRFVVLDDMSDAWPVKDWEAYGLFVQTRATEGLTEAQAEKAIAWLLKATL